MYRHREFGLLACEEEMLLLKLLLPLVVMLLALLVFFAAGSYRKIKKIKDPSPVVMGAVINQLCAVRVDEVISDIDRGQGDPFPWRVRRRARRNYFRLNHAHFCSGVKNATVFHGILSSEKCKVDENKSGLDYSPREAMIEATLRGAARLRWQQSRWNRTLRFRGGLRLRINEQMLRRALAEYKKLESDMVTLSTMGNCWYVTMMKERLGLLELHLVEDDEPGPESA